MTTTFDPSGRELPPLPPDVLIHECREGLRDYKSRRQALIRETWDEKAFEEALRAVREASAVADGRNHWVFDGGEVVDGA